MINMQYTNNEIQTLNLIYEARIFRRMTSGDTRLSKSELIDISETTRVNIERTKDLYGETFALNDEIETIGVQLVNKMCTSAKILTMRNTTQEEITPQSRNET